MHEVDGPVVNAQAGLGPHPAIIGQARAGRKLRPASELPPAAFLPTSRGE
ncbi:hypothetical protein [Streptomyces sp. PU-14G]